MSFRIVLKGTDYTEQFLFLESFSHFLCVFHSFLFSFIILILSLFQLMQSLFLLEFIVLLETDSKEESSKKWVIIVSLD